MEIGGTHSSLGLLHPLMDQIRFFGALRRFKPDIVHVNPSLGLKSVLRDGMFISQAVFFGSPIVVFFHGWDKSFEAILEKRWLFLFRRVYFKASTLVVLASSFQSKLLQWDVKGPVRLATTTVSSDLVYGFSIEDKLAAMRDESTLSVLFLARLARDKGALESMEAISKLRLEGHPIRITVAGDGEDMAEVKAFARLHDPGGHYIDVVGDVRGDEKKQLLASHHIYSFPSTYGEGMPTSVLEAMAFGMAVVTCPVGGIKDFFVEPDMGVIVAHRNSDDVAAGIKRLIADPDSLYRIAEANHDYANRNFMAPNAARFLMSCYAELADHTIGDLST
ncbi:glycosyltransferase [Halieaceae bacterium IMCC14734]|uniref:Glycosyltransferase n=1 Tax=Candidatus Litorirhabdus singularis TaxID=2518993 RepID=A0ABT3TFA0_9GAMM|nr:glycosyltransferase family 4 protein [Candidatus Litorirhabdus singularis]MCX2980995.1 glycosyltransferase [Candidatus Litorirhabdus singularis]